MSSSRVTIGSFRWAGCHESLSHTSQSNDWSQDVTSVLHFFVLTELQGGSFMIFSVIYDMFFRSNYLLFLWGTKREKKDLSKKLHMRFTCVMTRVHQTGGNRSGLTGYRSNRSGPVPVWAGTKPAQIQNSNLNSKKWKIPKKFLKILQGATNLMVSNFLKNSFI